MGARARTASGGHAAATEANHKAAETSGARPSVISAYAEAMTLSNGNRVPAAAKIIFGPVLAREPLDPRPRCCTAPAKAQDKDFEGELSDWLALYGKPGPDTPSAATVRREIVDMARFTGTPQRDILLDATPEEVAFAANAPSARASPDERIAEAEATLAVQPNNFKPPIELAHLHAQAGTPKSATLALDAARAQYPGAPFVQQKLDATARSRAGRAMRTHRLQDRRRLGPHPLPSAAR